jgi:phosphoglycolate phosphatase
MLDLDGTLVDTAPEIAAAASAALAEHGLPPVGEAQVRGWIGHGARRLVARASGSDEADEALLRTFEWHYAAISGRRSAPYADAVPALRELKRLGVALALVTNKETRFTAPLLHAHDLWQWFDAVICGDMVERRKPDPLGVEHCLARFRIPRSRALLVGDSEVDVATARNAGVAVWTVPYGYHCGRLTGESRPDRVVPTLRAVADAVESAFPLKGEPCH